MGDDTEDSYYVAIVTKEFQWFDGPYRLEKAEEWAERYNRDPHRNATIIGVR